MAEHSSARATTSYQPIHTAKEVGAIMRKGFEEYGLPVPIEVLSVDPGTVTLRMTTNRMMLRPGGTVSGPALFLLADFVGWACALSHVRGDPLTVTTNLNINFLRKGKGRTIDGHGRVLKIGKSLVMFDCDLVCDDHIIAQATGTYFIPEETKDGI